MGKYIITTGSGNSSYELNAFDNALLDSGIADFNLIKLSSILPIGSLPTDSIDLPKGSFLHTAYASYVSKCAGKTISAALAIGIPIDKSMPGVIMEASGEYSVEVVESQVTDMVGIAMKSRGIDEFEIKKDSVSMTTKDGYNCVIAAVSIW